MQPFNIDSLSAEFQKSNRAWFEFLRVRSLSMGLYRLQAGQTDQQKPHTEDEVYLVLNGKAWFQAGEQRQAVVRGTLIFVERHVEHCFYDITDDLCVLVFFAPAEGSLAS